MRKIFVTGGAGFIGSHVSEALLAEGFEVEVLPPPEGQWEHVGGSATVTVNSRTAP